MARFVLYRILGNDLPPRHSATQTIDNLSFLLAHEPPLEDCDKRFLLNRIADPARVQRLQALLSEAGHQCDVVPFELDRYRRQATVTARMAYVTNNNPARNQAIELGLATGAACVLPFDGATFFTRAGWSSLVNGIATTPDAAFFTVPMYRVGENARLLAQAAVEADAVEVAFDPTREPPTEPQLIFTPRSDVRFDEALPYGQAPKIELLCRLGVPGPWDTWPGDAFRRLRERARQRRSSSFGSVPQVGFVLRLESGNREAEINLSRRAESRHQGLLRFVANLERRLTQPSSQGREV